MKLQDTILFFTSQISGVGGWLSAVRGSWTTRSPRPDCVGLRDDRGTRLCRASRWHFLTCLCEARQCRSNLV